MLRCRAARRYAPLASAMSAAISRRWARTDSNRWAPLTRSSIRIVESRSRPACGPCTIASATARFSVTVGPGATRLEQPIERQDLRPVGRCGGRCLVVERGDRRLQLVRAEASGGERCSDQRDALRDRRAVPERAVLLGERHERPCRAPRAGRRASTSSISASSPRPRHLPARCGGPPAPGGSPR